MQRQFFENAAETSKNNYIAMHERNNESGDDLRTIATMMYYSVNFKQYSVDDQTGKLLLADIMLQPFYRHDRRWLHLIYFSGPFDIRHGHYEPLFVDDNDMNKIVDIDWQNNTAASNNIDDESRATIDATNACVPPPLPPKRRPQPSYPSVHHGRPRKMALVDEFYLYSMYLRLPVMHKENTSIVPYISNCR